MTRLLETEWGFTVFGATGSMEPVRKIPKNYRNVTGIVASFKAEGPAGYESSLERDFITLLEFCPGVNTFTVQPVKFEWRDTAGKAHTYTPDTYVEFGKKNPSFKTPLLCEVKYRKDLAANWLEFRPKFKAAVKFASVQGWRFKIFTEKEIRTPYLDNAKFLMRYRNSVPPVELMDLLDKRLHELRQTTPSGLIQAVFRDEWKQAQALTVLWYMVSTFQIGVDLHQPLTMTTEIWRKP